MILVLWTGDKPGEGPDVLEVGDILEVVPDGHQFSPAEIGSPNLRFVQVPILGVEADAFLQSKFEPQTKRQLQFRQYGVPPAFLKTLSPGTIETRTRVAMLALINKKP